MPLTSDSERPAARGVEGDGEGPVPSGVEELAPSNAEGLAESVLEPETAVEMDIEMAWAEQPAADAALPLMNEW